MQGAVDEMDWVLGVFVQLHEGEGEQYPKKLEMEPLALNLACAVENGSRDMLYILVGYRGRDR